MHSVLSLPLSPSELSQCDSIENVPRFQTLRFQCSSTSVTADDLLTKALALHSHQDCSWCPRLQDGRAAAGYAGPGREPGGSAEGYGERKHLLRRFTYLYCLFILSLIQSPADWLGYLCPYFLPHQNPHSLTQWVACSLSYLLSLAMCTGIMARCEQNEAQVRL